jgi:histone deacetylase 1/2
MSFDFSSPGEVKITMCKYIEDLIRMCSIVGTVETPSGISLFDQCESSTLLSKPQAELFHSYVAKCLYLAKRVRPDILLTVSFLASRVLEPNESDWKKLVRLLKYLNGTSDVGLILKPGEQIHLEADIDASYGVHSDGKSHSALHLAVGNGNILAKSTKQKLVCKSSTEAELVALSDMTSTVIWVREFLLAQGEVVSPANINQDNQSTMAMIERGKGSSDRTRHIKLRYFWIKDRVEMGDVRIVYKPTESMVADLLTKPLQGEHFKRLRKVLLNWYY